ncbi:MAG: beta-hydroxyacyl-ACP dehydratase [Deltaproteobacteria bacterium]|nr:beta-hydroxyacyl-ACP dehydratase [Deltaproteobacteria bacterium]
MDANQTDKSLVLSLVPQQHPFRFLDDILSLDDMQIEGVCRFGEDSFFYKGHFPGHPVTPGVILIEAMAQTGAVAHAIYLMLKKGAPPETIRRSMFVFTRVEEAEFTKLVPPGARAIITGEKIYFRARTIKTRVRVTLENGEPACSGILTGMGVDLAR